MSSLGANVTQSDSSSRETALNSRERIFTPANIITMIRICLVPVFVVALISPWPEWFGAPDMNDLKCWISAGIFILISCTDWLDGYLARSRNEVTDFGKFMDPMADKILVMAAFLALIELGALPSWVVLIILAREFIVSGVRMVAASKGEVIAASWYGKAKTVTQMIAIVLFIVKDSHMVGDFSSVLADGLYLFSWFMMIVALVLTVISMFDYIAKARHLIGFPKKGGKKSSERDFSDSGDGCSADREAILGEIEVASQHALQEATVVSDSGMDDSCVSLIAASAIADAADRVLAAARNAGVHVGTAESCTGGMIAAALTAIPGSSDVVNGAIVSYANSVKSGCLGVSGETLENEGAVSRDTALQMAEGARKKLGVDVAVSVTGIAGPGGAVEGKPVGTVWIGVSSDTGTAAHLFHFTGDRASVRSATVLQALVLMGEEIASL